MTPEPTKPAADKPPPPTLAELRASHEKARRALQKASRALASVQAEHEVALRTTASGRRAKALAAIDARVAKATEEREAARQEVDKAAAAVANRIGKELPPTPEEQIARLTADIPIVLLPVRLETRFDGDALFLRVYPDEIFADTHEPELTDTEVDDGQAFWRVAWPDEASERLAWKTLVDALGAPRAGWVADQTRPTNIADRPNGDPVFAEPPRRTSAWTRAAEARLLPDQWVVALYTGDKPRIVSFGPVREPLALTMSPDPATPRQDFGGIQVDDDSRWTIDFQAAQNAGMAKRIALEGEEPKGLRQLIVFGVKSSLAPNDTADCLTSLLEAHRHGRGVGIVAQGTPTNNTAAAPAPYPPPDPDASRSFASERRTISPISGRDGGRLARALGVDAVPLQHWSGADGRSDDRARAMARALWSPTLRYFLEQMMAPVFGSEAVALVQRFLLDYVRGRGPLAAIRIGNTPYGVLPVSSLTRWKPDAKSDALDRLLPLGLNELLPYWKARIDQAPHLGRRPNDPDADMLEILGMDASTREVRVRRVLGEDAQWNTFGMFGWGDDWPSWRDVGQQSLAEILRELHHQDWHPRVGRVNFAADAWPFQFGLVTSGSVGERDSLTPNYIDWISTAPVSDLLTERLPAGWTQPPRELLYKLLRHASLLEYHDASFALLERYGVLDETDRHEREIVGLPDQPPGTNRLDRLQARIPSLSANSPLHIFLSNAANAPTLRPMLPQQEVVGFRDALATLAPLPTAELERLFTETLDFASHRIDVWITALASKRLDAMRTDQPLGLHIGAYGWVESLVPRAAAGAAIDIGNGESARRQAGSGGFVQAPSLTHAAAAAIMRNAYLSRSGDGQAPFAVDLSSARVRNARFILDAVRESQPLGAVLGYQVESGLHEQRQDKAIDPLRREFPLIAGKSNDPYDATAPKEQIAARNVVDGLALRTAYVAGQVTAARLGFADGDAAWKAVVAELGKLDATVDGVADLLFAESIYQLVKGSPTAAAATLDAMAQGAVRPPDPEIATIPRRGTPVTHRVALVLGDGGRAVPAGWPDNLTPRAELEPALERWLGRLFGDPRQVVCDVELRPPNGAAIHQAVSLDQLKLRPIDVLALARAMSEPAADATKAGSSELERRVRDAAYALQGINTEVDSTISFERPANGFDPATDRTFADVFEVARAAQELLRRARPLEAADLTSEDRESDARAADVLAQDALDRATQLCERLEAALDGIDAPLAAAVAAVPAEPFDVTGLRDALRALALVGRAGSYPINSLGNDPALRPPLVAQATSMQADGRAALAVARATLAEAGAPAHAGDDAYRLLAAVSAVEQALGRGTPFIPRFKLRPPGAAAPSGNETELDNAIGRFIEGSFIGDAGVRDRALARFELGTARVRPAMDAWRRLEIASGLLDAERAPRLIAQLPFDASAPWVGGAFADQAHRHPSGRVSILLYRAATPKAADAWSGLFLDQWVEQIPLDREQTAVSFHYDDPGAEAPQAILVAVPPSRTQEHWDLDSLRSILEETLDLAKVRAVDGELLGALGQLLPAIFLADSADPVTIATDFSHSVQRERRIITMQEA